MNKGIKKTKVLHFIFLPSTNNSNVSRQVILYYLCKLELFRSMCYLAGKFCAQSLPREDIPAGKCKLMYNQVMEDLFQQHLNVMEILAACSCGLQNKQLVSDRAKTHYYHLSMKLQQCFRVGGSTCIIQLQCKIHLQNDMNGVGTCFVRIFRYKELKGNLPGRRFPCHNKVLWCIIVKHIKKLSWACAEAQRRRR